VHTDANTLDNGTLIEGDICIVGAGAAGISIALEWVDTPHKVILLEGGGFELEEEVQDLYRGGNIGRRYYPLHSVRLHFYGGTTGHWAGICAPYDPLDFTKRDWVPYSGWPIRRQDIDPFYAKAHQLVELGPYEYDVGYWENSEAGLVRLPLDEAKVWTKMWQFSPPTRFGTRYRDDVINAPNIHLYTHANVCNIEANEPVSAVEELHIKCLNGKEHTVRARYYVLACGAIQNARLLLASNRQANNGLGNDHDLVGRFFMEHPVVNSAYLVMPQPIPMKLYQFTMFETKARGELAVTEAQQREYNILNCTVSLLPKVFGTARPAIIDHVYQGNADASLRFWEDEEKAYKAGERPRVDFSEFREFSLVSRLEQSPNHDSCLVLSTEKDPLGVPRVKLNWQLTGLDKRSLRKTHEIIGREIGRSGLGRVQLMDWLLEDESSWPPFMDGGFHHMGTTRMHDNPNEGVVDADCKVHGLGNLYVAGSAVFPTAGAANSTLTLLALTLRLADHLKEKITW
jgi:choline dehydrogenase-like flavoprotein